MGIFLATLLLFALAFAGLALGVMLGREPVRGSCGGLTRIGLKSDCACESPCPRRRRALEQQAAHGPENPT